MERKRRPNEGGTSLYDPFPYWTSPRSTLASRVYVRISALLELRLPDLHSHGFGKDTEIRTGTVHRTLGVPEILNLIFKSDLSGRDLVRCALVCRLWGIWALEELWGTRPVPVQNVLQILAPVLKKIRSHAHDPFSRLVYWEIGRIDQDGWRRFLAISNKITTVTINTGIGEATVERVKRAMQSSNDLGEPFSHLRTLRIESNGWDHKFLNALSLVTFPSLTRIYVGSQCPTQDTMDWVCKDMPARAPHVTHLVLARGSYLSVEASRYAALKYLQIRGSFCAQVWESLASCRLLEKIVLIWCRTISSVERPEDLDLVWRLDYVSFPALLRLSALRELWIPDSRSDTGSMHWALTVPEILNLVFKSDFSDRDLVKCAVLCRLWGIWALDLLWETRPVPFHNVLRILTPALKRIEVESWNKDPSALLAYWEIGRIDPDSWRRFLAISNKITTVDIDLGVGDITFERIKRATQSFNDLWEPFSRLRTLRIESKCWNLGFMKTLSLINVPSLTHVLVDSRYPKQDIMDWVCNDVPARAPNVTHLVLERVSGVNAEASRYTALKYLQIKGGFRSELWESLASCPVLEKIVLIQCAAISSINHPEDLDFVWLVDYVYFPALRTLKIRLGYPSITVALILRSRMPMLERFCCDAQSAPSTGESLDYLVHLRFHSAKIDLDWVHVERSSKEWGDRWVVDRDDDCY
ncbi:hypothetical protein FS837_009283 [Tulasnella sp. UAMH 9824]|nr:hypothetical protein FS837_009283 [Tulasnella sp. UAMH 9824]